MDISHDHYILLIMLIFLNIILGAGAFLKEFGYSRKSLGDSSPNLNPISSELSHAFSVGAELDHLLHPTLYHTF